MRSGLLGGVQRGAGVGRLGVGADFCRLLTTRLLAWLAGDVTNHRQYGRTLRIVVRPRIIVRGRIAPRIAVVLILCRCPSCKYQYRDGRSREHCRSEFFPDHLHAISPALWIGLWTRPRIPSLHCFVSMSNV